MWSTCPGCGLILPGEPGPAGGRRNASAACWQLYGEVTGFEALHPTRLGRFHQLTVDAYAAQHPAPPGPPIGTAFALIGLRLALDEGMTGPQVRAAHEELARRHRQWPTFPPPEPAAMTVFEVAAAGSPDEHAELVQRWAAAVWAGWRNAHGQVAALLDERLPPDARARLRAVG